MAVSIKHIILAYLHKNKLFIPGTEFKELLYNTDTYTFNKIQMVNKQFQLPTYVYTYTVHVLSQPLLQCNYSTFHYCILLTLQEWIQKNGVLSIVLKDNLHQPQVTDCRYDYTKLNYQKGFDVLVLGNPGVFKKLSQSRVIEAAW